MGTSTELAAILAEAKIEGQLEDDDPEVRLSVDKITEVKAREDKMADIARTNIYEGLQKLKSSVALMRLLAKEQRAGNLQDDDAAVVEIKAKIALFKQEEGGS